MKRIISVIACILLACSISDAGEFLKKTFISSEGQALPYRIVYPQGFNPDRQYPLLLFLHGAGERGTDNDLQLFHGRDVFEKSEILKDVIVVAPQCPEEDYWIVMDRSQLRRPENENIFSYDAPISHSLSAVKELLDAIISLGFVDTERIYGTGLSMGGFGVLDLTCRYPDFFAAVQPICAGCNPKRLSEYNGRTRFRFFHGGKDDVVPPFCSEKCHEALLEAGKPSERIVFPEDMHNSWHSAFALPDYLTWFFE